MMKQITFTGQCPQCELYNEVHAMRENDKNWECPSCNLQILIENNKASIFRHRGKGRFKYNLNSFQGNLPYQEVGTDSYPTNTDILTEPHLIKYLLLKVDQKPKYSVDRLIDAYENYRFNDGSKEEYLQQSNVLNIDFDSELTQDLLAMRDKNQNLSDQYSTRRLHPFLVENIFPKYHNSDNSYLPEMGMSQLQFYLCKKHFPDNKRELINSNPLFIRQALKDLIIDLIDIIYHNEDVTLSYNPQEQLKIKQEKYDTTLN